MKKIMLDLDAEVIFGLSLRFGRYNYIYHSECFSWPCLSIPDVPDVDCSVVNELPSVGDVIDLVKDYI